MLGTEDEGGDMALIEKIGLRTCSRNTETGEWDVRGIHWDKPDLYKSEVYYVDVKHLFDRGDVQVFSYKTMCFDCQTLEQCAYEHGNYQAWETGDGHDGLRVIYRWAPLHEEIPSVMWERRREELSYEFFTLDACMDNIKENERWWASRQVKEEA